MNIKAQKHFSITGFSPMRVAYVLCMFIIALVPTDFSDECFRYRLGNAIWVDGLVLGVLVTFFCILAPRNTHRRFLPVVVALFGLLALMLCEPI